MTDQTPEADQTPESRLTAALWDALEGIGHIDVDASERGDGYGERAMLGLVRSALAADPTLAADLALAAAVRRLDSDNWGIVYDKGKFYVSNGDGQYSAGESTPTAAIQAAKEASE